MMEGKTIDYDAILYWIHIHDGQFVVMKNFKAKDEKIKSFDTHAEAIAYANSLVGSRPHLMGPP